MAAFSFWGSLVRLIADQDDIRVGVAAHQSDFAAVRGPVEVPDVLRLERGELFARGAVQRLLPQVVDAIFANHVKQRLPVARELDQTRRPRALKRYQLGGGLSLGRYKRNLFLVSSSVVNGRENHGVSIRRNSEESIW